MQTIDKEGMFITEEQTVLYRIWIEDGKGILDMMRPTTGGQYQDAFEAEIIQNKGSYTCQPRHRGKDIFEDWMPLLTQELLNPITTGFYELDDTCHLYGKGLLQKYSNPKSGIKGWRIAEIERITEEEFRQICDGAAP